MAEMYNSNTDYIMIAVAAFIYFIEMVFLIMAYK